MATITATSMPLILLEAAVKVTHWLTRTSVSRCGYYYGYFHAIMTISMPVILLEVSP